MVFIPETMTIGESGEKEKVPEAATRALRRGGRGGRVGAGEDRVDERYGHMVHEHATSRVREVLREREERLRSLGTRRQAERYVLDVRDAVARAFGRMPARTPLRPRLGDVHRARAMRRSSPCASRAGPA